MSCLSGSGVVSVTLLLLLHWPAQNDLERVAGIEPRLKLGKLSFYHESAARANGGIAQELSVSHSWYLRVPHRTCHALPSICLNFFTPMLHLARRAPQSPSSVLPKLPEEEKNATSEKSPAADSRNATFSACGATFDYAEPCVEKDHRDTLADHLARAYRSFALSEAHDMNDWVDAAHFGKKSFAALTQASVSPEHVEDWWIRRRVSN